MNPASAISHALCAAPPWLLLAIAIVAAQLGAGIAYFLFPQLGPLGVVSFRLGISALILIAATRPSLISLFNRQGWIILIYGLLLAGMNIGFYSAIERIPLGIAITIGFMGPLAISIVMSRRALDFVWIAFAVGGIALLSPDIGNTLDPVGIAFAVIDAVCWASLVLISRRIAAIAPGNSGLALGMGIGALIMLPMGVVKIGVVLGDPMVLIMVTSVAVLSTTIPFTCEFEALKRMTPRLYGLIVTTEPAFALCVGALMLGQSVNARTMLAIACIIAAAVGATMFTKSRKA